MPLLYHHHFTNIQMGIWRITEPLAFFDERNYVKPIGKSIDKYTQHVAGWHTVQWLAQGKVIPAYHEIGFPYDKANHYAISISHARSYAAALIAPLFDKQQIGIDVEMFGEKAFRLRKKFTNAKELTLVHELCDDVYKTACIIWSMKEAVYKKMQEKGVRFKDDININHLKKDGDYTVFEYRFKTKEEKGFVWIFNDFCCCICF
jgi:phosphopantetheinyl transferase (holo-ACP synthase)